MGVPSTIDDSSVIFMKVTGFRKSPFFLYFCEKLGLVVEVSFREDGFDSKFGNGVAAAVRTREYIIKTVNGLSEKSSLMKRLASFAWKKAERSRKKL